MRHEELQPCNYRPEMCHNGTRTFRAPKFRHTLMDATSIVVLVIATAILVWYGIQAWQLDHDSTHPHDDEQRR